MRVTEYRAHFCRCGQCGAETRAWLSEAVAAPVQYGPRNLAIVVYLAHYQLLPGDRLAELMGGLFGVKPVLATIARMRRSCATVPDETACQLPDRTETVWVESSSTGSLRPLRHTGKSGPARLNRTALVRASLPPS